MTMFEARLSGEGGGQLRALIITDDAEIFNVFKAVFASRGFESIQLADNRDFVKEFYEYLPDVVVVEDRVSVTDSVDLCLVLRQLVYIPLVLVSRDQSNAQVLRGLQRGADIYVGTQFSSSEFMARVEALLRRRHRYWDTVRESLDTRERTLRFGVGAGTRFSPTEFRLLCFMLLSRHRTITLEQMLSHVWAGKKGKEDSVRFYLRRLREKLERETDWRIISRRGAGYRLVVGPESRLASILEPQPSVPAKGAKRSTPRRTEGEGTPTTSLTGNSTVSSDNATVP